jgi:tetratricopeptide (TPR) repeat protein
MPRLREAFALSEGIGDRATAAVLALNNGNAFLYVPGLRDLDQAEHWFRRSLSMLGDEDLLGRAGCFASLGGVALELFFDAVDARQPERVLIEHLNAALDGYQQALDLTPADDHQHRATTEGQLGIIYSHIGDTRQALRHFQQSVQHNEARSDIYGAGQTRCNIAILLDGDGRVSEALLYARAALDNFRQVGPGAAADAAHAEQLIAYLEQRKG